MSPLASASGIVIVDYGMGNVGSIQNMLRHLGFTALISSRVEDIETAHRLIIAGVGAFDTAMTSLAELGLLPVLHRRALRDKVPVLGICLGMQIFTAKSQEGKLPGLGWFDAETVRFRFPETGERLKVPHMGWNRVSLRKPSRLTTGLLEEPRFYFVHSFHCVCNDTSDELMTTAYGQPFASAIERENLFGVQFHPEKSHRFGMKLLENFARID